jgi:hypothetical protein
MAKTQGVRLTSRVRARASGLLDMLYTPAELADELGVAVSTVRLSYLPNGAPHTKDEAGRAWIPGRAFAEWAAQQDHRAAQRQTLGAGEGYCVRCKKPVMIVSPTEQPYGAQTSRLSGACPECHRTVNRIVGGRHD